MDNLTYFVLFGLVGTSVITAFYYYSRKNDPRQREITSKIYFSMQNIPLVYRQDVAEILRGLSELCPNGSIGGVESNVDKILGDFDL